MRYYFLVYMIQYTTQVQQQNRQSTLRFEQRFSQRTYIRLRMYVCMNTVWCIERNHVSSGNDIYSCNIVSSSRIKVDKEDQPTNHQVHSFMDLFLKEVANSRQGILLLILYIYIHTHTHTHYSHSVIVDQVITHFKCLLIA